MGKILNESQCMRIDIQRKRFKPYAQKGWMCEGSDAFGPFADLKTMATIQGKIRKISLEL